MTVQVDSTQPLVSLLSSFVVDNMPQYGGKKNEIFSVLKRHYEFGTLDFGWNDDGVIYVMRYNITPSGKICEVLDLCVAKDYRSKGIIKYIISKNWDKFPSLRFFRFLRSKYPNRKHRLYEIAKFFKEE